MNGHNVGPFGWKGITINRNPEGTELACSPCSTRSINGWQYFFSQPAFSFAAAQFVGQIVYIQHIQYGRQTPFSG